MTFANDKKVFVESLGLEMHYHVNVLNYNLQSTEDIKLFVKEFLTDNFVSSIMKFKVYKQTLSVLNSVAFVTSVKEKGKEAYESLLCEYVTDGDYERLRRHDPEKVYNYWENNKTCSAMSIDTFINKNGYLIGEDENVDDLFIF